MKLFYKALSIDNAKIDKENKIVEVSFATEDPYQRSDGLEIMALNENFDLSRLNDRHPLLFNHDQNKHIGTVLKAWITIENGKKIGRAIVQFANNPLALEKWQDVLDGHLTKISYGYIVKAIEWIDSNTYRVIETQPYEISFVVIPADNGIGLLKSLIQEEEIKEIKNEVIEEQEKKEEQELNKEIVDENLQKEQEIETINETVNQEVKQEVNEEEIKEKQKNIDSQFDKNNIKNYNYNNIKKETNKMDKNKEIGKLINLFPEFKEKGIEILLNETATVKDFEDFITSEKTKSVEANTKLGGMETFTNYNIGNGLKALQALSEGKQVKSLEIEVSNELQKQGFRKINERSILIPISFSKAYNNAGVADIKPKSFVDFIDPLRAKMVLAQAGARFIDGLTGEIKLPKMSAGNYVDYIDSNTADAPLGSGAFTALNLTKKTAAGSFIVYRDALLMTNYDVKTLGLDDALQQMARFVDSETLLHPTDGLYAQLDSGAVAITAAPTYADVIGLKSLVEDRNALINSFTYLMKASKGYELKARSRGTDMGGAILQGNNIDGDQVLHSSVLPTGNILGGDFSQLVMGSWGVMEISENPFKHSSKGAVEYTVIHDFGSVVRNIESFQLGKPTL